MKNVNRKCRKIVIFFQKMLQKLLPIFCFTLLLKNWLKHISIILEGHDINNTKSVNCEWNYLFIIYFLFIYIWQISPISFICYFYVISQNALLFFRHLIINILPILFYFLYKCFKIYFFKLISDIPS